MVVFDEQHASRIGQVEIATMLNRLYHTAGLRNLGVEGDVVEKPRPDLGWFAAKPDPQDRLKVALQMLKQGEVSAAEFAAMVLPGFQIQPIEHESEHRVEAPGTATQSYTSYLVAIAVMSMTDSQVTQAESLLKQKKNQEAVEFIIGSVPWTKERYDLMERKSPVPSTEEMQRLGSELEEKATAVGADVSKYRKALQDARAFFDMSTRRSTTMTELTTGIAGAHAGECAPIAMNIGAAHTAEITSQFGQKNMSYAVVSPSSLESGTTLGNGSLSMPAFDRKVKGRSVDPDGGIGAFLDGRRKPSPASQNRWFKIKAEIAYAIAVIARAVSRPGDKPPYGLDRQKLGLAGTGPLAPSISIDPATISVVPVVGTDGVKRNEAVFQVNLLDKKTSLWIRTGFASIEDAEKQDHASLQQILERELKKMGEELKKEPLPDDAAQPKVAEVVSGLQAAVSDTKEGAMNAKLFG
ncbi:hypothetical protein [Amycolatopsis oliviviridis]|uniref:hypothetical protein n=1 Tax=Amycolatopsis oliviviridis TaxID=1471590 RepID=UPI00174C04DA|nr:hypothetical protein [Amycolatopsis oliviviridis]